MIRACIFDLDGVIVDTAKYHYLAWKRLANQFSIDFSESQNENLKGVSRKESLEYILGLGKIEASDVEKAKLMHAKNEWYLDYISRMDESEILPGVVDLLKDLKNKKIKIALGSASKNAIPILDGIKLTSYFDFIADGNSTDKSKPDPEVFLIAAKGLNERPEDCIVIEDSIKGLEAANTGRFMSLGVGDTQILSIASHVVPNLLNVDYDYLVKYFHQ